MAELPDVKVIHLVRDPREIIGSRNQTSHYFITSFFDDVKYLCQEIVQDINVYYDVVEYYPDRVIQLKIEDLFRDPSKVARVVYKFLDLTYQDQVAEWLFTWKSRTNATDLIHKWQKTFNVYETKALMDKCGQVINILQY